MVTDEHSPLRGNLGKYPSRSSGSETVLQLRTIQQRRRRSSCVVLIVVLCGLAGACATPAADPAVQGTGTVADRTLSVPLDHEAARHFLEDHPDAHPEGWHHDIEPIRADLADQPLHQLDFTPVLARPGSVDLAALLFIDRVYRNDRNAQFAACVSHFNDRLGAPDTDVEALMQSAAERFHVVFVPGWLYEDHTTTEADFARTRSALERAGITHELLDTKQDGTVEANAAHLADHLRNFDDPSRELIIVSASKSGAEVHYALGHLLSPEESATVTAWINAGGLLRGTAVADDWTRLPRSLVGRPLMAWHGWSWESLLSLRTDAAAERLARSDLPATLRVINYIPVPMTAQMTHGAEGRHARLARLGPNDGAGLLTDAVAAADDAITLTEPEADHYFLRTDIGRRTLALTRALEMELDERPCAPYIGANAQP